VGGLRSLINDDGCLSAKWRGVWRISAIVVAVAMPWHQSQQSGGGNGEGVAAAAASAGNRRIIRRNRVNGNVVKYRGL